MTDGILFRGSAIALGVAAFVSFSALSQAHADAAADTTTANAPTTSAPPVTAPPMNAQPNAQPMNAQPINAPAPSASPPSMVTASQPSLAEPAPTPAWAEAPANSTNIPGATHGNARHYAIHHPRHYARWNGDPVRGVVGGVADLGAVVTYPLYCFPRYGYCPVRVPYRF